VKGSLSTNGDELVCKVFDKEFNEEDINIPEAGFIHSRRLVYQDPINIFRSILTFD